MKGHTNNPNGRPKGTPNKVTTALKEWALDFIESNKERLQDDFDSMEPVERWGVVCKLFPYLLPKLATIQAEVEQTTGNGNMTFEEFKQQLADIIDRKHAHNQPTGGGQP